MNVGVLRNGSKVTAAVAVVVGAMLALHGPASAASCQKTKLTAAAKKTGSKLKCHTTAVGSGG